MEWQRQRARRDLLSDRDLGLEAGICGEAADRRIMEARLDSALSQACSQRLPQLSGLCDQRREMPGGTATPALLRHVDSLARGEPLRVPLGELSSTSIHLSEL